MIHHDSSLLPHVFLPVPSFPQVALAPSAGAALCPASEFPAEPLILSCAPGSLGPSGAVAPFFGAKNPWFGTPWRIWGGR